MVKYLSRFGYSPRVIAFGDPKWRDGQSNVSYIEPFSDARAGLTLLGKVFQKLTGRYSDRVPWVPHAYSKAADFIHERRPIAVVSTSPPIASHLTALCLRKHYKLTWIADFQDPFFGNPFHSTRFDNLYSSAIERLIFSEADGVIANTDTTAAFWCSRYPQWARKVNTIWNGFDPEETRHQAKDLLVRSHRVMLHAGDLYGARHPGRLLESVARLISKRLLSPASISIRLLGPIDHESPMWAFDSFKALASRGCLQYNATSIPRADALAEAAEADFLLLLDLNQAGASLQLPAKIFDYIPLGRPILAFTSKGSPAERILSNSGVLYCCIYPDTAQDQVDKQILSFLNLPTTPAVPSDWFLDQFDARAQTKELASMLQDLTTVRRPKTPTPI
jgi:hypothetical protein